MQEQARIKYRELPNEEKKNRREYGINRCQSTCEENKQRLKEYQKKKAKKLTSLHGIKVKQKALNFLNIVIMKVHSVKVKDQLVLMK